MPEPLHLKDALKEWKQDGIAHLAELHRAIHAGPGTGAELAEAEKLCEGEMQRFAMLLDRLDERQGKKFRSNRRTVLQKVRALLGYTYP